jgi:hypothetical protein
MLGKANHTSKLNIRVTRSDGATYIWRVTQFLTSTGDECASAIYPLNADTPMSEELKQLLYALKREIDELDFPAAPF